MSLGARERKGRKMKTLEDYMKLNYRLEFEPDEDEGGYVAYFPELPGCITMGDTIEEAAANAVDAKRTWLEVALENEMEIPLPKKRISIPVSLNFVCPRLCISF